MRKEHLRQREQGEAAGGQGTKGSVEQYKIEKEVR